jgi:hypothetical protein
MLIPSLATTSPLSMNIWQRPVHPDFLVAFNQILGGDSQSSIKRTKIAIKRRRAGTCGKMVTALGKVLFSNNIGVSFAYLMCLSFCVLSYFVNVFFHALYRIVSCITCLYFWKHTQASRFGGELAICPMTISQGSDVWNTQLISECLLGNYGYTCLNHFSQRFYTVFTKTVTRQIWDPSETR